VRRRVFEGGDQTAILSDVVRRDADRCTELFHQRAVGAFDADAVPRGPGIAAGSAVDVGDDVIGHGVYGVG